MPTVTPAALLLLAAPCLALACLEAPAPDAPAPPAQVLGRKFVEGCPSWGCTGNSPVMGPYSFHELDLAGSANDEGISIASVRRGGTAVRLALSRGRELVAATPQGQVFAGAQLEGVVLSLDTPSGPYQLVITKVHELATTQSAFWVGPPEPVETYELAYEDPSVPERLVPLCNHPPARELRPDGAPAWNSAIAAVLFGGDRYDAVHKEVTASSPEQAAAFINLGCAGSALAKMLYTRNTTAGSNALHWTSAAQRQAMLKMFTADMCGTGYSFTLPNTPLRWQNTLGWGNVVGDEPAFEAFWNEHGAMCLDDHRLGPVVAAAVQASCPLPACQGMALAGAWRPGAHVKTLLPPP